MGKRKNKAQVQAKVKVRSSTVFDCPLCDNVKCIEIKFEKKSSTALLKCRLCGASAHNIPTNSLTKAVDVFSSWIDNINELKKKAKPTPRAKPKSEDYDAYDDDIVADASEEDDYY